MGYIHIYTGDGKGKTTAAFGLAIRALMSGKKIYIGQFVKDMAYEETKIQNHFDNITVEQLGKGCFIERDPDDADKEEALKNLKYCGQLIRDGKYDMVILDELTIAIYFKLVSEEQVLEEIFGHHSNSEIIITGRYCPESLIEKADLVTEMKEIKHYYQQGVLSRTGIDH